MNKLWIYLGCLAIFGVVGADQDDDSWYGDDYWYNDEIDEKQLGVKQTSSDFPQSDEVVQRSTTPESSDDVNDKKVKEEIDKFWSKSDEDTDNEEIDYYQIEDNRSEVEDEKTEKDLKHSSSTDKTELKDDAAEPEAVETELDENEESNLQQNLDNDENNDDYVQNLDEEGMEDNDNSKDVEDMKKLEENGDFDGNNESGELEEELDNDDDTENELDEDVDTTVELADERPVSVETQFNNIFNETKRLLEESDEGFNDDENIQDEENSAVKNSEEGNEDIDDTPDSQNSQIEDIFNETRRILEKSNEGFNDDENIQDEENSAVKNSEEGNEDIDDTPDIIIQNSQIEDIFNETRRILEESNEGFIDDENDQIAENSDMNNSEEGNIEDMDDDTLDKALQDLKDDLSKLHETLNKLRDDDEEGTEKQEAPGLDEVNKLSSFENEEDYEEIDDQNFSKIFEDDLTEDEYEEIAKEVEVLKGNADEKENENENVKEEQSKVSKETDENDQLLNESINYENITEKSKLIQYVDDALVANEATETTPSDIETSTTTTHVVQVFKVEPLEDDKTSSSEFERVLNDILGESEEKPTEAEPSSNSKETTELNRITLTVDKPVVVTSPNYPNPYPTNVIVDWLLEGEGVGIELNVTDFSVNGQNNDYVLIKPGSDNPLGSDGLVFSHTLRSVRMYRFLDVNRVFIRFESNRGMSWQRGFSISVKMMNALPKESDESEPEALPVGYPESTITLNLGGVTLEDFFRIKETFRGIIADMATMYINANQIEPGINTTLEVTQITSMALCFHNWPKFEQCAEVRFGVPLQYADEDAEPRLNEEDLKQMWWTYSKQDPFALRLSRLGITEFQVPNDYKILMVWLVIAAGVVISMAMLAFALWRFSCFEDYTRMPAFSDTESITEKKTLDLYPTPHQTLPPLYSDTEYKWGDKYEEATRVDMGGFANRSYVRTDDYDYDSEEEAVPARDRYTTDV